MNLSNRVDKLEDAFIHHLEESGEIRADIKWLKRSFWWLVGIGVMATAGVLKLGVAHVCR